MKCSNHESTSQTNCQGHAPSVDPRCSWTRYRCRSAFPSFLEPLPHDGDTTGNGARTTARKGDTGFEVQQHPNISSQTKHANLRLDKHCLYCTFIVLFGADHKVIYEVMSDTQCFSEQNGRKKSHRPFCSFCPLCTCQSTVYCMRARFMLHATCRHKA